jgi:AsmA protein
MKAGWVRWTKKIGKIVIITIVSLLSLLFLLPYIMPATISQKIKTLVNHSIDGKIEFSKARLSFFNHFPSLTLTLYDFSSTGSAPYQHQKLFSAGELALGIRILPLIKGEIHVDKFFLSKADVNIMVNEKGEANYNIYRSASNSTDTASSPDSTTALKIEKIVIEKANLVYNDSSSKILINTKGLNYTGKGDLSKAIFDLRSDLTVDSFDFYYETEPYILKKRINASLITKINTNSLAFEFTKNKLRINRLPLEASGKYEFLKKGYYMNFELKSDETRLRRVFTVLPPAYLEWMEKTKMKGTASITASLSGRYITGTDTMPDLAFSMKVRDGYIAFEKAPAPVSNLYLDFASNMKALNLDSLSVNIDSVFFNVDKDYFHSVLKIKGFKEPYFFANVRTDLDLEKFDRALGLEKYDLKGKLNLMLNMNGKYATGTSIPAFNLQCNLRNGYFHYRVLPAPVDQINFNVSAKCPNNDSRNISATFENIDIKALDNSIKGFVRLANTKDFPIDADLDVAFRLSDIKKFYPLDSLDVNGDVLMNIRSTGNYQPAKKMFPKTEAIVKMENGSLRTKYYPAPIEKIAINATVKNKEGTLSDLEVAIQPVSFEFEGKPFMIKADLENFNNVRYHIVSRGEIDLGKIYKVFSQKGWDVKGTVQTDFALEGNQADAVAGSYSKLHNKGTVKLNSLLVYSDLYPLPFLIDNGLFRFNQDELLFENFRTTYGKSVVVLNGSFSNLFNYIARNGPLKGDIQLQSHYLLLDELMNYNPDNISETDSSSTAGDSGVIMVPADLAIKFTTDVNAVDYNKLHITSVKGNMMLRDTQLRINNTGFEMAGAKTTMDGSYKTLSANRAWFSYHIKIDEFDVSKMYNEVELFRQLVPAAASARGIISLNYALEGKLGSDMYPILPSLKGGGVLAVKDVKMKGFKFFSAMSKETGKSEINDPDLKKIDFKTSIKNNVVTLEKTKIKVAGFRIRVQGQTSLDGQIKFNCRLGLPPFGIIGIPIKATGTGENPKITVGKTDKLPLKEQEEEKEDVDSVHNGSVGPPSNR